MNKIINIPKFISVGKSYNLGGGNIEFDSNDHKKILNNLRVKQKMNSRTLLLESQQPESIVIGHVIYINKNYITLSYIDNDYISYENLNDAVDKGCALAVEKFKFKEGESKNSFRCVMLDKYILSIPDAFRKGE